MSGQFDQEPKIQVLFTDLRDGFQRLSTQPAARQAVALKGLTEKMQEAKSLIKDFEREARMEGMPVATLASRKKSLVQELNGFIAQKKTLTEQAESIKELTQSSKKGEVSTRGRAGLSTSEAIQLGKKEIASTDLALVRAQKVVADTIDIGAKTAETLDSQTKQLERIMDDLEEIHFSMKKASQVIKDMTRGMATDKCIRAMLLLVILGAITLVALRIAGVGNLKRKNATPRFTGRRLQVDMWIDGML